MNIAIITGRSSKDIASRASESLSEIGINVYTTGFYEKGYNYFLNENNIKKWSAIIFIIQEYNDDLLYYLAYLTTIKKHVWILTEKFDRLPNIVKKAQLISIKKYDFIHDLISQIQVRLGICRDDTELINNPKEFITWIQEKPERISNLSAKALEAFVSILFSNSGFLKVEKTNQTDLIFKDPAENYKMLIKCKGIDDSKKIGIGTIDFLCSSAELEKCHFSILLSSNEFTPSAIDYSKTCYPPLKLIDKKKFESQIKKAFSSKNENTHDSIMKILGGRGSGKSSILKMIVKEGITQSSKKKRESLIYWKSNAGNMPHLDSHKNENFKILIILPTHKSGQTNKYYNEFSEKISNLLTKLSDIGVEINHDSQMLEKGNRCTYFNEINKATRRSNLIIFLIGSSHEQLSLKGKIMQTIASEINKTTGDPTNVLFVAQDNFINRFSVPNIFSECTFADPSASWEDFVLSKAKGKFLVSLTKNKWQKKSK